MKTNWTKGLDKQAAQECRDEFVSAARMRERLKAILLAKAEEKRTAVRSGNTYENPNWALLQADAIGYEKAIFEVISLIT